MAGTCDHSLVALECTRLVVKGLVVGTASLTRSRVSVETRRRKGGTPSGASLWFNTLAPIGSAEGPRPCVEGGGSAV